MYTATLVRIKSPEKPFEGGNPSRGHSSEDVYCVYRVE